MISDCNFEFSTQYGQAEQKPKSYNIDLYPVELKHIYKKNDCVIFGRKLFHKKINASAEYPAASCCRAGESGSAKACEHFSTNDE